jgi:hypothetical protein
MSLKAQGLGGICLGSTGLLLVIFMEGGGESIMEAPLRILLVQILNGETCWNLIKIEQVGLMLRITLSFHAWIATNHMALRMNFYLGKQ